MPREGHDKYADEIQVADKLFQSTCPARGTTERANRVAERKGISIHVPREGHDRYHLKPSNRKGISIHVPREGHDGETSYLDAAMELISIHVPREGHDSRPACWRGSPARFQSTCPARGTTTPRMPLSRPLSAFQSTCPARGTTWRNTTTAAGRPISIHVPREGHDLAVYSTHKHTKAFQSTCPARGTTTSAVASATWQRYFNPRAPRGARHVYFCHI